MTWTRAQLDAIAARIESVLRAHKAPATVVGGRVLPTFIEFLAQPSPETRVSRIRASRDDIALAVGRVDVRIAQSGSYIAVQIGHDDRQPVAYEALIGRLRSQPQFTALLGIGESGLLMLARLDSPTVAHLLIAGTTGSGKTQLARTIIASLVETHKPRDLGLVVVDPKRRTEDGFEASIAGHLLAPIAREGAAARDALLRVQATMERRTIGRMAPSPRIVVYVDECADLCMADPAVTGLLTRIAQRGREVGIHLLVCTQKPTARALDSLMKANLPLRLVGKVVSPEDAKVASGVAGTGAEHLAGCGDFIAIHAGRRIRFQAALTSLRHPNANGDMSRTESTAAFVEIGTQASRPVDALCDLPADPVQRSTHLRLPPQPQPNREDEWVRRLVDVLRSEGQTPLSKNQLSKLATDRPYAGPNHCAKFDQALARARQLVTEQASSVSSTAPDQAENQL